MLFLIPLAIPSATSAFFWENFFGLHGTLNKFLAVFHMGGIDWLNITDSYLAIILPGIFNPLGVFLLRQFMKSMPDAYTEAAKVDGAGYGKIFIACDRVYILSFWQRELSFSIVDLSNIEDQGIDITYAQRIYPDVSNAFRSEEIPTFVTNENYAYFTDAYLVKGAFFNEMQIERKLPLAVANEAAAYQLFGSQECVGEERRK